MHGSNATIQATSILATSPARADIFQGMDLLDEFAFSSA
jgi:hypothetical protein